MNFKNWLKTLEEASTDTGDIASFARPIFAGNWRMYPDPVIMDDPNDEKKKHARKENKKNL